MVSLLLHLLSPLYISCPTYPHSAIELSIPCIHSRTCTYVHIFLCLLYVCICVCVCRCTLAILCHLHVRRYPLRRSLARSLALASQSSRRSTRLSCTTFWCRTSRTRRRSSSMCPTTYHPISCVRSAYVRVYFHPLLFLSDPISYPLTSWFRVSLPLASQAGREPRSINTADAPAQVPFRGCADASRRPDRR